MPSGRYFRNFPQFSSRRASERKTMSQEPKPKKRKLAQQKLNFFCPPVDEEDKSSEPDEIPEKSRKEGIGSSKKEEVENSKEKEVRVKQTWNFQAKWVADSRGHGNRVTWVIFNSQQGSMGCLWCRQVFDPPHHPHPPPTTQERV